jgi:cation transport ATPase
MAVWTALGTAAQRGVLFRSGESLERLAAVRAVRFDKTGTLTTGTPRVESFETAASEVADQVAQRAIVLAEASTHVFARAIQDLWNSADGRSPHSLEMSDARTVAGCGIQGRLGAPYDEAYLGSVDWLVRSGQDLPPDLGDAVEQARTEAKSFSGIAWNGKVRGLFIFAETLRAEARTALAQCRELGCEVGVLTGDTEQKGKLVAQQLGVQVEAALLPEAKLASLERLRARVGPTAMVGDGVNDAPALAASDVGIALGCGTDLARESAPVALLSNNLLQVPWAIQLARQSVRVMRQNLCWAFSYNIIGIGLAATGWLNPAWAAVAMVGSSLLVVGNSMRLQTAASESTATRDPAWFTQRSEADTTGQHRRDSLLVADTK